jgi:hypothetical protein
MKTHSAAMLASRNIAALWALITSSANALVVMPFSRLIVMLKQKPAHGHALVRCKSVDRLIKTEDVYCLTVPSNNLFAVGSGVVVHNCMDATRYVIRSGLGIAVAKELKDDKPVDPFSTKGKNTGGSWMVV